MRAQRRRTIGRRHRRPWRSHGESARSRRIVTACTYARVGSGEVGRRSHAGRHGSARLHRPATGGSAATTSPTTYSVRSQERAERLEVQSSDGLGITLDTSIRYHVIPDEVLALDQELGPDYYHVLLGPTLKSQARRVVGRYKPEEIYSTQRETDRAPDPRGRRGRDQGPPRRARGGARPQRRAARAAPGRDHRQARGRAVGAEDEVRDRAARGRGSEGARGGEGRSRAPQDRRRGRRRPRSAAPPRRPPTRRGSPRRPPPTRSGSTRRRPTTTRSWSRQHLSAGDPEAAADRGAEGARRLAEREARADGRRGAARPCSTSATIRATKRRRLSSSARRARRVDELLAPAEALARDEHDRQPHAVASRAAPRTAPPGPPGCS